MGTKKRKGGLAGLVLAAAILAPIAARAAMPQTISHQGFLTDTAGPVNGTVPMVFSLYDASTGGAALWTESQSVSVSNGTYTVVLGSVTPLNPATLPFNKTYWLGVTVGADAEMTPRMELTSVGYAFRAAVADSVADGVVTDAKIVGPISGAKVSSTGLNAEQLGGIAASNYLKTGTIVDNGSAIGIGTAPGVARLSVSSSGGFMGDYSSATNWGVLRLMEGPNLRSYLGFGDPGGFLLNSLADSTGLYAVTGGLHLTASVDARQGITITPSGKVGIGTTAPGQVLSVIDSTAGTDSPAISGQHSVTDYYGIGVSGKGGYKGLYGEVLGTGGNSYYGAHGKAQTTVSPAAGSVYGGYFTASGGAANYGVYGSATQTAGTGATFGGYFVASGALNNYGIYASGTKNFLAGNVGLGTTTPGARLHLKGTGYPDSFMFLDTSAAGQDSGLRFLENGATKSHLFWNAAAGVLELYGSGYSGLDVTSTGSVGIGTRTPADKLHVWGNFLRVEGAGGEKAYLGGDGAGSDVQIGSMNASIKNVAMYNPSSSKYMALYAAELHIMGGADLAEPFESAEPQRLEPGMLAAIDPANPGQLTLADEAYDKKVAGVVSGANGIKPGVTMAQEGTAADGTIPLALVGRVYAWADASYGAIEPGDLLTTSDTPGHAMKVTDHARAQGAIVGKAMSGLSQGTGKVLLLVTLQ